MLVMMKLTVSLGQMNVKLGDVPANLATVKALTVEAVKRGSDLVVFPELWSTGYDLPNAAKHANPTGSGIFSTVASLAKEHGIVIVGSMLSLLGDKQYGNTAVYFDHLGRNQGEYSKVHLFRLMDEDQYLTPGQRLALVDTIWGKFGLAICYDLRFPELFRAYALAGANVTILPSEWPNPRLSHWQTLLRVRSIENQMFMIACNRVGKTGDTSFFGHSCIIDPWGEIIVEAGDQEILLTAEIDLSLVQSVKSKMPIFTDRRPDIYNLP